MRIFLGTEEGQYRAERVFVWSILQVRDPARVYEIHLMKNVAGFDRRGWRTGFTCYRFAIPDFAGRTGKAIYNDVDQIYLADPALLFDLPLDGHGYLAIDARDTSVMLIDCERMLPWWNRAAASARGAKGPLTSKPAEEPGLWGELDAHWNARDLEYVEGRTKCLHYTALHQQPWNPFPEAYSYHQNPLAYIWHDLERGADAAGFEVFTREAPSPGFAAVLGSNQPAAGRSPGPLLSDAARRAPAPDGRRAACWSPASAGRPEAALGADRLEPTRHDFAAPGGRLPEGPLRRRAGRRHLRARPRRGRQLGAARAVRRGRRARWCCASRVTRRGRCRQRGLVAPPGRGDRRPLPEGELGAGCRAPARHRLARGRGDPGPPGRAAGDSPLVWALTGEGEAPTARRAGSARRWAAVRREAAGLRAAGGPARPAARRHARRPRSAGSAPLAPPWPDVLIASGRRSAPVARWIRRQSGGRTRLVQLGRPGGAVRAVRPDRGHARRPAADPRQRAAGGGTAEPSRRAAPATAAAAGRPARPVTPAPAPRLGPYVLDERARPSTGPGRERGGRAAAAARWSSAEPAVPASAWSQALRAALARPTGSLDRAPEPRARRCSARADRFIVTAGDGEMLAEAP